MLGVVAHQDVFDLDVAVDNVTGVECLNTLAKLSDNALSVLFLKRLLFLLANVVEKVACWHEFCHDVVCDAVLEGLNKLKNVLVVLACHLLANHELLEDLVIFLVCSVNFTLLDNLYGNLDL